MFERVRIDDAFGPGFVAWRSMAGFVAWQSMDSLVFAPNELAVDAVEQGGICDMEEIETDETPSRLKYPGYLRQSLLPTDDMVQHRAGQDDGEPTVVEGQVGGIGPLDLEPT